MLNPPMWLLHIVYVLNYDAILSMRHSVSQVKGLSPGSTKRALQWSIQEKTCRNADLKVDITEKMNIKIASGSAPLCQVT